MGDPHYPRLASRIFPSLELRKTRGMPVHFSVCAGQLRRLGVLESNHIACLGSADPGDLGVLGWWTVHQCGADMVVGGICGDVSAERVTVTIVLVSWVNKRSLCIDADAILVFFVSLVHRLGRRAVATGRHRSPLTCSAVSMGEFRLVSAALEPPQGVSRYGPRERSGRVSPLEAHLCSLG